MQEVDALPAGAERFCTGGLPGVQVVERVGRDASPGLVRARAPHYAEWCVVVVSAVRLLHEPVAHRAQVPLQGIAHEPKQVGQAAQRVSPFDRSLPGRAGTCHGRRLVALHGQNKGAQLP